MTRLDHSEPRLDRIKGVLVSLVLSGSVSLEAAAIELGTTPRTLQRSLGRRDICFRALVEQSRFEIAGALLRETELKIQEIASGIGYSTPSAFARAFTRWANCTPRAYRRAPASRKQEWREMGRRGSSQPVAVNSLPDRSEEN